MSYHVCSSKPSNKWKDVIHGWKEGKTLQYHTQITKSNFFWETSPIITLDSLFQQKFVDANKLLDDKKQNFTPFKKYIHESTNKYVVSFLNLSGDTLLIVPMPRRGKNYSTLKAFIDNASQIQQQQFWKRVANEILNKLYLAPLWVSTHGISVPYFHLRICTQPKYYHTTEFSSPVLPI